MKIAAMRTGAAPDEAVAVAAERAKPREGVIASSSGSAIVAPMPRRTVRRDMGKRLIFNSQYQLLARTFRPAFLERIRRDDLVHQHRKLVPVLRHRRGDFFHGAAVVVL